MSEQRLIDANDLGVGKANPDVFERKDYAYGWNSALQAVTNAAPTIDPETLPIVQELRAELERVIVERDAAVNRLHGYCSECKNYTEYHGQGLCATCCHEHFLAALHTENDNWEWKGV